MIEGKILVTGTGGFLGTTVLSKLISRGYDVSSLSGSSSCDLRLQTEVDSLFEKESPDIVIHLAGRVGGIGINKENPGRFLYDNLMMGANLIEKARQNNCKKFVMVGTVCSYPKYTEVPFKEDDIWNGYPEETNAPYGIAKKTLMQMIISYKEQYGFNGINLIPVNMYGPHDNFNPNSSHVIPAIILKIKNAMKQEHHEDLEVWGTGSASREFLYVEDSAEAIISAMENLEDPRPVNIGTGNEIKIFDLVNMIAGEMGFKGNIVWDKTKPDGQPRRCLDISRAREILDFEPEVSLEYGIQETVKWFEENKEQFVDYFDHI